MNAPTTGRPRRLRTIVLAIFVTLAALIVVGAGAAVAAVVSAGTVAVHVDERGPAGGGVHLVVPAALIEVAVGLAPDDVFAEVADELRSAGVLHDGGRALRALAAELDALPDAVLVEVRDGASRIRIESASGRIRVSMDDPETRVRVDVPVRSVTRVIDRLAEA